MKVVFINPPNTDQDTYIARSGDRWPHKIKRGKIFGKQMFNRYPIYLMYSASIVDQSGYETYVIDAATEDLSSQETINSIKEKHANLVVVEIAEASLESDIEFIKQLKTQHDCIVAITGPTATHFRKKFITSHTFIDLAFNGENFSILRDFIAHAMIKEKWNEIKGLAYIDNGEYIETEKNILLPIEELPWPNRQLLDQKDYLLSHFTYKPQMVMISSIGCPHKCVFCLWPQTLYGPKMRFRSPDDVAKEMLFLKNNYGAKEIYFDDDTFNINEKRAMEISQAILDNNVNISWMCQMRCDRVSDEMLKLMKKSGCVKILYGVESGSQEVLDLSGKRIKREDIISAFEMTHKNKIRTHGTFMLGLPGENEETIKETFKLARILKPDTLQCSLATPYPGTEFYELAKKEGWLKYDHLSEFDGELGGVIEYPGLRKEVAKNMVNEFYKQYYFTFDYILRQLPRVFKYRDLKRFINMGIGAIRRFS